MNKIIVFKDDDLQALEVKASSLAEFRENGNSNSLYLCLKKQTRLECLVIKNAEKNLAQSLKFAYFEGFGQDDLDLDDEWFLNANFIKFKPIFEQKDDEINISFSNKIHANALKISSVKPLNEIKFTLFERKIKGLMLAPRDDFYGSRLLAMTNALYLAQKTGFKFAFVWATCRVGESFLGGESEFFTQEFIKRHSYTNALEARSSGNFRIRALSEFDLLNVNGGAFEWGWICCYNDTLENACLRDFDGGDYRRNFRMIFHQLDFLPRYKEVFSKAKEAAKALKNFVGLHLRGGDVVHINTHLIFKESHLNRLFPPQIAQVLIEKFIKNHDIVLFCKDKEVAQALKAVFDGQKHGGQVFISDEFADEGFDERQRDFFDMYLMSFARLIIQPKRSTFSLLASLLGDCELACFSEFIDENESFELINAHFNDFSSLHPLQSAATSAYLYALALRLNKNEKIKCEILFKALKYDKKNQTYKDLIIENLPLLLDFMEAENARVSRDLREKISQENKELHNENVALKAEFFALQKRCFALQNQAFTLQKDCQKALHRHENFLSYKLGNALIKAYKDKWRGGLFKFFFCDAWRIYRDFKGANLKKASNFKKVGKNP